MVQFVEINGAQIAYQIAGPEDGDLIITLHGGRGFGSHESEFKAYLPLSDKYRLLAFDFRGHGRSSHTKPYTFEQIVDDCEAIRQRFAGHKQCLLIGGSFGGFLAQQFAIKYPTSLSHLILRGTAPSYHHEINAIRALEQRISKAPGLSPVMLKDKIFGRFESDIEFQLVMWAAAPLYSETFDADKAIMANLNTRFNTESHNDLYGQKEKYFDYRKDLKKIVAKTLIVVGELDWICPPEQSKEIASQIHGAKLMIFAGANHSVHHEKNADVISAIREHVIVG